MTHTQTQGADGAGTKTAEGELSLVLAQLRHAYTHLHAERVREQREFADGLIAPQIRRLEAIASAPVATPGVPDSLRALSEAATQGELNTGVTIGEWGDTICAGPTWTPIARFERQEDAEFFAAAGTHVRALIAAQPAGQGTEDTKPSAGRKIIAGLQDAVAFARGDTTRGRVIRVGQQYASDQAATIMHVISQCGAASISNDRWCLGHELITKALLSQPAGQAGDAGVKCAARHQGTAGGNDPADCDWPMCGCDPHADKVIAALQECGHLLAPAPNSTHTGAAETEETVAKALYRHDYGSYPDQPEWDAAPVSVQKRYRALSEAALAARPEAPSDAGKGRPIDTAPKDRSEILLFGTLARSRAKPSWFIGAWFPTGEHGDGWWVSSCAEVIASAWAPLPTPPSDPAPSVQAEG